MNIQAEHKKCESTLSTVNTQWHCSIRVDCGVQKPAFYDIVLSDLDFIFNVPLFLHSNKHRIGVIVLSHNIQANQTGKCSQTQFRFRDEA